MPDRATEVAEKAIGLLPQRWLCRYCDTYYAEYVNGCPRCHLGEPGTATGVECVRAIFDGEAWQEIKLFGIAALLRPALDAEWDAACEACAIRSPGLNDPAAACRALKRGGGE